MTKQKNFQVPIKRITLMILGWGAQLTDTKEDKLSVFGRNEL